MPLTKIVRDLTKRVKAASAKPLATTILAPTRDIRCVQVHLLPLTEISTDIIADVLPLPAATDTVATQPRVTGTLLIQENVNR